MAVNPRAPSACIVNYNGAAYLETLLSALSAHGRRLERVVLIDNGSRDKSLSIVETRFPWVEVIRLSENRGPGAARNRGMAALDADRILFLDNDVEISAGCIEALEDALNRYPEATLAMPSVRYGHKKDVVQFFGAGCHFLGLMQIMPRDAPPGTAMRDTAPIQALVTACFMMDRHRYQRLLCFDESFFFNLEDLDFSLRTRLAGHQILSVPAAVCFHYGGTAGISYRDGREYPAGRVPFLIRNRWQVLVKCYGKRTLALLAPALALYESVQLVGVIRRGWFRQWLRSLKFVKTHLGGILRNRRLIQDSRRLPDREYLRGGRLPITAGAAGPGGGKRLVKLLGDITNAYWDWIQRWI